MKKLVTLLLLCMLFPAARAEEALTLTLSEYQDRVAAGIVGHVAGVLSGFEFVRDVHGEPWAPLPEDWFSLLKGPYGGGSAKGGAGVSRMLPEGIGGDDDYHIDFFNQHILAEDGVLPSHAQIAQQWREHGVSDWGGGAKAMEIIRAGKLTPPFTGLMEYGNLFHWCTEAYIESETLGFSAAGMPFEAYRLAERFAGVIGDFDSLDWGCFWSCAYAQALVERDVREILSVASGALLAGSHPARVYEACLALYDGGVPWRDAIAAVEGMLQRIPNSDNVQCAPDVNNGFALLALLYGGGDWLESVRLASISGYDADCTAATVGGLLGAALGLDGLPREVLDTLWKNGEGVYVNDPLFTPHIRNGYPDTQTFGELAALYVQNGIAQTLASGGAVDGERLLLPPRRAVQRAGYQLADFEDGVLTGEQAGDATFSLAQESHTGESGACIKLSPEADSAALIYPVDGLKPGETYRVSAYVTTSFDGVAQIGIEGGESVTAYNANKGWCLRECYFSAPADGCARVVLRACQLPGDGGVKAYFDDVRIERIETRFDATPVALSIALERRDEATLALTVPDFGDYALIFRYESVNRTGQSLLKCTLDGESLGNLAFPGTTQKADRFQSVMAYPLRLTAGEHALDMQLQKNNLRLLEYRLEKWPVVALDN